LFIKFYRLLTRRHHLECLRNAEYPAGTNLQGTALEEKFPGSGGKFAYRSKKREIKKDTPAPLDSLLRSFDALQANLAIALRRPTRPSAAAVPGQQQMEPVQKPPIS
jgi:hypothetical protein